MFRNIIIAAMNATAKVVGNIQVKVMNGVAIFNDLTFIAPPGSNVGYFKSCQISLLTFVEYFILCDRYNN